MMIQFVQLMVMIAVVYGLYLIFINRNKSSGTSVKHITDFKYPSRFDIDNHSPLHYQNKGQTFKLKTVSRPRVIGSDDPFVYDVEF